MAHVLGTLSRWFLPLAAALALACDSPGAPGDESGEPDAGAAAPDGSATSCPFAPGSQPQKKVVFVDSYPDADLTIEDEVIATIHAAVPGSRIRVGLFTFTRVEPVEPLLEAHRRGVDVRIVLDRSNKVEDPPGSGSYRYRRAVRLLLEELGDRVVLCSEDDPAGGACIGTGINHNKLFLFSELCDGSKDVVMQSSANLTNPQLVARNNTVVIRDDPELYAAYEAYWEDLHAQEKIPGYYRRGDGSTGTRAYFYPRESPTGGTDPQSDTAYLILQNNVECAPGSRIRVAMAFWTMPRGYLVDALAAKRAEGCDVKVIVSDSGASDALKRHLEASLPAADRLVAPGVHHKFFLVDSPYAGAPRRRLVWTGSHNFTGPALRTNDETLLRIDDESVFQQFDDHWEGIWATR